MKTVFALAVVALVASSLAAGQDEDFETLRDKLFAKDAQILDKQQVIELLKKIQPLAPSQSEAKNDIIKQDIDSLLNAGVLSENLCRSYELFADTFQTLSQRSLFKKSTEGSWKNTFSPEDVDGWNENIMNYINTCEREQFAICLAEYREDMRKLSAKDKKIIDNVWNNRAAEYYTRESTIDFLKSALSPKLTKKPASKLSPINVGLKNRIKTELDELFQSLLKSCRKLQNLSKTHGGVIFEVDLLSNRDYNNLTLNEETKAWLNRENFCDAILYFAKSGTIMVGRVVRLKTKSIYTKLLDEILAEY